MTRSHPLQYSMLFAKYRVCRWLASGLFAATRLIYFLVMLREELFSWSLARHGGYQPILG
jgi:hypothetical protein